MATWKSAAYDGRYLQLDISESVNVVGNSSTLSWTLTSTGGASTYYTIDTTTVTINGTTVYSKDRTYWDDRVFPAKKGSVSGTITVAHNSNGSKTIAVGFSTRVYIYGPQEYGGSMTLTTIDRSAYRDLQYIECHGKRVQNLRYILCHGGHLAIQHKRRFELDAVLNDRIYQRKRNTILAFAEHELYGEGQSKAAVQPCLRHFRQFHGQDAGRCCGE